MSESDTKTQASDEDITKPETSQGATDNQPQSAAQPKDLPETNTHNPGAEALKEQVEKLQQQVQQNMDGWQRARAEFMNYKKRTERQLSDIRQDAALDTLSKILPIIDDFERAVENIPDDLRDHPWVSGTSLILKKFEKLLEEHNIETIDPVGEAFDPNKHEAIGTEENTEVESGHVSTTLQRGYMSGDRVLRAALVRVAS